MPQALWKVSILLPLLPAPTPTPAPARSCWGERTMAAHRAACAVVVAWRVEAEVEEERKEAECAKEEERKGAAAAVVVEGAVRVPEALRARKAGRGAAALLEKEEAPSSFSTPALWLPCSVEEEREGSAPGLAECRRCAGCREGPCCCCCCCSGGGAAPLCCAAKRVLLGGCLSHARIASSSAAASAAALRRASLSCATCLTLWVLLSVAAMTESVRGKECGAGAGLRASAAEEEEEALLLPKRREDGCPAAAPPSIS